MTVDRLEAYRQAGVDLDLSNVASQIAGDYCRETWANAGGLWMPHSPDRHLASSKVMPLDEIRRHADTTGVGGVDGTGTKPEFYERSENFRELGSDFIAMTVDDIAVEGGEAVWVNNGLIANTVTEETIPYFVQLFEGLRDSANDADVVLWTGEVAIHGDRLQGPGAFAVDWLGDAFGLVHKDRVITGAKVEVGDVLYGFGEPDSFRCNGISRVRKTFKQAYDDEWHNELYKGIPLGEWVSVGSTIYAGLMKTLTGGYNIEREGVADIHGVAHISGGSLPEKLGRMLRTNGYGADITNPFEFPEIMRHCQEVTKVQTDNGERPMTDEEALTTWHGGQGYVVAAPESDHDAIIAAGNEHDVAIQPIGVVTQKPGLRMLSKGVQRYGETLTFELSA